MTECPKCGRLFPHTGKIGIAGVFIAIGIIAVIWYLNQDEDKAESGLKNEGITVYWWIPCESDNDGIQAYRYAQQFVKGRLTSPSSAEFPDAAYDPEVFVDLVDAKPFEECTWEIRSYVDFAGASGARLREEYTAKVKFNVDNSTWYLVDLQFYE